MLREGLIVELRVPSRLATTRLVLRTWRPEDRPAFAAINADPAVMEHLGGVPLSAAASDALADRIEGHWCEYGFGLYAVERAGEFVGFVGLTHHRAFPDEVEIGWRLAFPVWGYGYAMEAALACRDLAFGVLGLSRIISVTVAANRRSWRVMEKLGMSVWRDDVPFEQWRLRVYALQCP